MNKLVDQYNNNWGDFINRKPINTDYYALSGKTVNNPKTPKFTVNDRRRNTEYNKIIFLTKATLRIDQEKYLLLILF